MDFSVEDEWFECEAEAGADIDKATRVERSDCEANPHLINEYGSSYAPDIQSQLKLVSAGPATAVIYASDISDANGMNSNAASPGLTTSIVPRTRHSLTLEIGPSRLNFRKLQVELPVQESPQASNIGAQGITDLLPSCSPAQPGTQERSKIAPRKRRGFTKLTLEIRPPKFKKKLWFGTWHEQELDRATDAINYYVGKNGPFILPDSPLIFSQHTLGIEYRELKPSCEEFIQVGQKHVLASMYFARRVKEVIKAVTRDGKEKVLPPSQLQNSKDGPSEEESLQNEATQEFYEPSMSCASSSTYFSCASGSTYFSCASGSTYFSCASDSTYYSSAEDMVSYGASSEAHSELALVQPTFPLPSEMLSYEGWRTPIESDELCDWNEILSVL